MHIIFYTLSFFAIVSAFVMIYAKEPMTSALSFIVTLLSLAGLFALFNATFLFLVQIIVYAGAIITLILLIIMFLNIQKENLPKEPHKLRDIFIAAILLLPIDMAIMKSLTSLKKVQMLNIDKNFGDIKSIGLTLYSNWLLPFELISILLIVSLIGAIIFAKRKV